MFFFSSSTNHSSNHGLDIFQRLHKIISEHTTILHWVSHSTRKWNVINLKCTFIIISHLLREPHSFLNYFSRVQVNFNENKCVEKGNFCAIFFFSRWKRKKTRRQKKWKRRLKASLWKMRHNYMCNFIVLDGFYFVWNGQNNNLPPFFRGVSLFQCMFRVSLFKSFF